MAYLTKKEMDIIKKEWYKRKSLTPTAIVGLSIIIKEKVKSYDIAEKLVLDYEKLIKKFEN